MPPVMAMVLRRLIVLPVLLLCSAALVFFLAWVSPYDPAEAYVMAYGPDVSAELRRQYVAVWGLDAPAHEQFFQWLANLLRGDWGQSRLLSGQPVAEVIAARLGPSAMLVGAALLLVLVWGLAAGLLAAAFQGTWVDGLIRLSSYFSVFAPSFWVALLAVYVFSVRWGMLPAGGIADPRSVTGGVQWSHLLLPAVTLALSQHGWFTLYVRNTLLEVLRDDYVRYAEANGVGKARLLLLHALPNALLPFVTLAGTHLPELIGGSILIESIFGWPGLGNLTRQAAMAVDVPLLLGITVIGAAAVVTGNLVADVLYHALDPRIREAR